MSPALALATRGADVVLLLFIAVAWPLFDYLHEWPEFSRKISAGVADARLQLYRRAMLFQWTLTLASLYLWSRGERAWRPLSLLAPTGTRLWVSVVMLLVFAGLQLRQLVRMARRPDHRRALRKQVAALPFLAIVPRDRRELIAFCGVSVTAGVCEEVLFRGYVVRALGAWTGRWLALCLSIVAFGLLHASQGRSGIVRSAAVGVLMTAIVLSTGSLWPAIALHTLIDLGGGAILFIALRETGASVADSLMLLNLVGRRNEAAALGTAFLQRHPAAAARERCRVRAGVVLALARQRLTEPARSMLATFDDECHAQHVSRSASPTGLLPGPAVLY